MVSRSNCVANGRLLREGPFENLWIQPAAGDAGGAVGAALYGWHQILGEPREVDEIHDGMQGAYLGPRFGADEIATWLDDRGYPYERLSGAPRRSASHARSPTATSSGCCRDAWSTGPVRSGTGPSSLTPAHPRCSRS